MRVSSWACLLISCIALALFRAAPAHGVEPIQVGDRTCLFLDDRFVAEQSGLARTWHQGTPNPEPAITATQPWEKWPHMFGSMLYDPVTKLYKMWYVDNPVWTDRGGLFYAESTDAKVWTKPELGLVEHHGSKANNCLFMNAELPNVFLDPNESDPQARFKMLIWRGRFTFKDKTIYGHILYSSGDGIHWNIIGPTAGPEQPEESHPKQVHDTNQVIWDSLAGRYLGDYRTFAPHAGRPGWVRDLWGPNPPKETIQLTDGFRRAVGISTSKQILAGWSPIEIVLKADAIDDERAKKLGTGPEPDWAELYIMPMFTYGNHYLGMLTLLYRIDAQDTVPGSGDLQLTFSHDGLKWHRQPARQSLVAPGPSKLIPVFAACNEPLDFGDEMWIFYTESTGTHVKEGSPSALRSARWRKDGFVSLDCAAKGSFTTPPLVLEGEKLFVNSRTSDGGSIRVAVLDQQGKPIAGLLAEDCNPLTIDAVAHQVTWRKQARLADLQGKPVQLRFEINRGQLYSFRFGR